MKLSTIGGFAAAVFALALPTAQALATDSTLTVDALRAMNQTQLNTAYVDAEAGPLPDGDSQGTAVFFPNSGILNEPTQLLAALAWQGKVFDTKEGVLENKVFGFKAIKAEVFYGDSLLDGKESIIIDYANTSVVAQRIRDEIREVAPGLYLGRAYWRGLIGNYMVVNFILDFNKTQADGSNG